MTVLIKRIDTVLRWSLVLLATAMIVTVCWQVLSRYALKAPSSLTEEIARFQLIWLGLLGAVYAFRNRAHVSIDILVTRLGGRSRLVAEVTVLFVCILFAMTVLIIGGAHLVTLTFELQQTSAALGVRMAYVYAIVPVSGVLICVYCVHFIIDIARHGEIRQPNQSSAAGGKERA